MFDLGEATIFCMIETVSSEILYSQMNVMRICKTYIFSQPELYKRDKSQAGLFDAAGA